MAGYTPWGHKELDMTEQLTHTKKGGIVSHFAVINIKFSEKGSNVPSQVGAETNIQPLSLLPKFLPQCKSTLPSRCRPGWGTGKSIRDGTKYLGARASCPGSDYQGTLKWPWRGISEGVS